MKKIVVLNSGGFDSVVLMHELGMTYKGNIISIFFDYGQRNAVEEEKCARRVSDKFEGSFIKISLPEMSWTSSSLFDESLESDSEGQYVEMRNLIFLSYAVSIAQSSGVDSVYTAFIKMDDGNYYPDTSPEFVDSVNMMLSKIGIKVIAPFHEDTKDLLGFDVKFFGIQKEDFFSCNTPAYIDGTYYPCMQCPDCLAVNSLYYNIVDNGKAVDAYMSGNFSLDTPEFEHAFRTSKYRNVKLFINNDCQFKCSHCLYGFEQMKGRPLNVKEFKDVLSELYDMGIDSVDFGGKEPFFDDTIFEYARFLKTYCPEMKYTVISNGVNVRKYIRKIAKYFPEVTLSVESLEDLTVRPSYDGLTENISLLIANEVEVSMSIDLHDKNKHQMADLITSLYSMGVRDFYLKPLIEAGLNAENVTSIKISPSAVMDVMDCINTLSVSLPEAEFVVDLDQTYAHSMIEDERYVQFLRGYLATRIPYYGAVNVGVELFCGRFIDKFAITPDGYVLGCGKEISSPDYVLLSAGNITQESLVSILERGKNTALNICRTCPKAGCYFSKYFEEKADFIGEI